MLYYVDPARKDRTRLVVPAVLRQELMKEVHLLQTLGACRKIVVMPVVFLGILQSRV